MGGSVKGRDQGGGSVTALDGIDLTIQRGERVGLIGHNGAGKSTLLRLVAGIYYPASGSCEVSGRVSTLFTNFLGVNRDATGLENIVISGLTLGLTRKEIDDLIPDIVEFSELGQFLHMPVHTYSAGMQMRLGFSVATAVHPDILLIDEVFGTGDRHFRVKAKARISKLLEGAGTLLFASHSESAIQDFCNRLVWLEHGRVRASGPVQEVLAEYHESGQNRSQGATPRSQRTSVPRDDFSPIFQAALDMLRSGNFDALGDYFPNLNTHTPNSAFALRMTKPADSTLPAPAIGSSYLSMQPLGFPAYRVTLPVDWHADPFASREWRLHFLGLTWIEPYLRSDAAKSESDRDVAIAVIRHWLASNLPLATTPRAKSEWERPVAISRLQVLFCALPHAQRRPETAQAEICAGILAHCALLASSWIYQTRHTIGLRSDAALISACEALPESPFARRMAEFAAHRLLDQAEWAFTEEGVPREHSPALGFLALRCIVESAATLDSLVMCPEIANRLRDIAIRAADFAAHIRSAVGLPRIGAGMGPLMPADLSIPEAFLAQNPGLRFAIRRSGDPPGVPPYCVFPESGWAAFRNSWSRDREDEVFLAAQADFGSKTRYQEDDTSFVLSAGGKDYIVDPGPGSADDKPMQRFAKSNSAHNLLVPDGMPFDCLSSNLGRSGITRYFLSESSASNMQSIAAHAVELTHPHYESRGIHTFRQIAWLGDGAVATRDIALTNGEHDYALLLHLDQGARVEEIASGVVNCIWDDRPLCLYLQLPFESLKVIEGQLNPRQGWVFPRRKEPAPAPVLEFNRRQSGELVWDTLIVLARSGAYPDFDKLRAQALEAFSRLAALPRRLPGRLKDTLSDPAFASEA